MKVTLNKATLTSIHSLSAGVSTDDVAPVITQIALKREGDQLRAMATDRYIVLAGLYSNAQFEDWADGEEVLVDPKHLKSVVDIVKKSKFERMVGIHRAENGNVSAFLDDGSGLFIGNLSATFPPVIKLFPSGDDYPSGAGHLNLRPDFLAKLAKVLPPEAKPERYRTWRFEFRSEDNLRPQPVYAQYSNGEDYKLEALIQPALDKRS